MNHSDPRTTGPPDDLEPLVHLYRDLPPRKIRWRTSLGRDFLIALDNAVATHQARRCAEALGISTTAVYQMIGRSLPHPPVPYPEPAQLRQLQKAWRAVEHADHQGIIVRRTSREFVAVHKALTNLTPQYDVAVIALALQITPRRLRRFLSPPATPATS